MKRLKKFIYEVFDLIRMWKWNQCKNLQKC